MGEESGELIVAYYNVSIPTIHGKMSEGRDHITSKGSHAGKLLYILHTAQYNTTGTTLQNEELLYKVPNTSSHDTISPLYTHSYQHCKQLEQHYITF